MVVVYQNNWHRNAPGRAPQVLTSVFVDVHGEKVSCHVSKARLSLKPRARVQHRHAPHYDY